MEEVLFIYIGMLSSRWWYLSKEIKPHRFPEEEQTRDKGQLVQSP